MENKPACVQRVDAPPHRESLVDAFGIPECMPPVRRRSFYSKPACVQRVDAPPHHESLVDAFGIPECMPPVRRQDFYSKKQVNEAEKTTAPRPDTRTRGCCFVEYPAKTHQRRVLSDLSTQNICQGPNQQIILRLCADGNAQELASVTYHL